MALKMVVDKLEEVAEPFRAEYRARDGKFVLDVSDGFSRLDRDALSEALRKEREDHDGTRKRLKGFGDLTPEQVDELREQAKDLELKLTAAGATDAEKQKKLDAMIEERVGQRLAVRVKPVERKLEEASAALAARDGELAAIKHERSRERVVATATSPALLKEVGISPDAADDIALWAEHHFELDSSGRVVARASLGNLAGSTLKDVLADMKASGQRKLWFGPTQGAGARGGAGGDLGENPFAPETYSLTKIGAMVAADPQKAVRYARAVKRTKDWDPTRFLPKELQTLARA